MCYFDFVFCLIHHSVQINTDSKIDFDANTSSRFDFIDLSQLVQYVICLKHHSHSLKCHISVSVFKPTMSIILQLDAIVVDP